MTPLQVLLAVSLLANIGLASGWLQSRDRATAATGQRDEARADASACSDATDDLRALADRRAVDAKAARAVAQALARPHEQRADKILSTPASAPGDDCRSARERGQAWLKSRTVPP